MTGIVTTLKGKESVLLIFRGTIGVSLTHSSTHPMGLPIGQHCSYPHPHSSQ